MTFNQGVIAILLYGVSVGIFYTMDWDWGSILRYLFPDPKESAAVKAHRKRQEGWMVGGRKEETE